MLFLYDEKEPTDLCAILDMWIVEDSIQFADFRLLLKPQLQLTFLFSISIHYQWSGWTENFLAADAE